MINITQYFKRNVKKDSYYDYHFISWSYDDGLKDYVYFDEIELIDEFKKFLIKVINNNITYDDEYKFVFFIFYLKDKSYYIEQFPNYLERPNYKAPLGYFVFAEMERNIDKKIFYGKRSIINKKIEIINSLNIKKKKHSAPEEIENLIKKISTRNADFVDMGEDEILKEICNGIEYLLNEDSKKKDNFIRLDISDNINIINDDKIRDFRKTLECFRHSSKGSIEERKKYSLFEKDMMIRYGIFVLETIIKKLKYK